jgi:RNA polymerase sigma factor (sigma-70 family)
MQDRGLTSELESLYRERFFTFVRVAGSITGNFASGQEAVQEAFARAIERIESFRGDGSLESWVWRIVINTSKNLQEPHQASTNVGPEIGIEDGGQETSVVHVLVRGLPERQRLAIFLRYWADLDYASIARALGVEVGTVSATLNAAHDALRVALQQEVEHD